MRHLARIAAYPVALLLLGVVAAFPRDVAANDGMTGPPLSDIALQSAFAREHGLASSGQLGVTGLQPGNPPAEQEVAHPAGPGITEVKVNQDYSQAPQNETNIAINPTAPNMLIAGANDYRLGNPVGAAFYTSFDGGLTWNDGFPPFPLLAGEPKHDQGVQVNVQDTGGDPDAPAGKGGGGQLTEPPFGTGDPVLAFGPARAGSEPDLFFGTSTAYYAYLGVSSSFCEQGIFVSRSTNGLTWTRPAVPSLLPPNGQYTPVYWDHEHDCSVFNDKPWLATDTSNGPHRGRVYVVWARFLYSDLGFRQSTIMMSYSDTNAETWSAPVNVNGVSDELCPAQVSGKSGRCDESQFASAAVGPDGTLRVAFVNQQAKGQEDGFRNQYLITSVNPDTLELSGPYRAAAMIDGRYDFPVNGLGQATLCNSNFRLNTAGNLAIDPSDPAGQTMYIVFADDRNGSSFPNRDMVTQTPPNSFGCPAGKTTDADIFIVRSTDGGVTWSTAQRVNQDPVQNGRDQWFPFAAVGLDGRVSVVFNDRRDDPSNRFENTYLARSANRELNWTETKVSTQASNLNLAFDNGVFIGDYNGLAVGADGTAYPFWTDSREAVGREQGQSDVYIAVVPP